MKKSKETKNKKGIFEISGAVVVGTPYFDSEYKYAMFTPVTTNRLDKPIENMPAVSKDLNNWKPASVIRRDGYNVSFDWKTFEMTIGTDKAEKMSDYRNDNAVKGDKV